MARVAGFKPLAAARPRHKARICYAVLAIIVGTVLFLLPAEKIKAQVAAPAKLQAVDAAAADSAGDAAAADAGGSADAGAAASSQAAAGDAAAAAADKQPEQQQQQEEAEQAAAAASTTSSSAASSSSSTGEARGTGVFFTTGGKDGKPEVKTEMLIEPVPEDCYMEEHADYDGPAITWGLDYKLASAAQCCQACKDLKKPKEDGTRCNVWVWCGSPTGECWSPDIWNHTSGECWLKYQKDWDNSVDRSKSNLAVNLRGRYPPEFRKEHKTAPEAVAWTAGVIPA